MDAQAIILQRVQEIAESLKNSNKYLVFTIQCGENQTEDEGETLIGSVLEMISLEFKITHYYDPPSWKLIVKIDSQTYLNPMFQTSLRQSYI